MVKRVFFCYKHCAPLELFKNEKTKRRTVATQSLKPFKKTFAIRNPISYLCTVLKFIESYHERRRDRPDETLATLYHKEGAKFYLILIHSI